MFFVNFSHFYRFISIEMKSVKFEDSLFEDCRFEDIKSTDTVFENCTIRSTVFYNTGSFSNTTGFRRITENSSEFRLEVEYVNQKTSIMYTLFFCKSVAKGATVRKKYSSHYKRPVSKHLCTLC